jgi:hypothetical protein
LPAQIYDIDATMHLASNRQYGPDFAEKKTMDLIAAFWLFMQTSPIDLPLLWQKWKYIKSKMPDKLKGKQTSIAILRTFATFTFLILSRYRLPVT